MPARRAAAVEQAKAAEYRRTRAQQANAAAKVVAKAEPAPVSNGAGEPANTTTIAKTISTLPLASPEASARPAQPETGNALKTTGRLAHSEETDAAASTTSPASPTESEDTTQPPSAEPIGSPQFMALHNGDIGSDSRDALSLP
jgi:hypothetical protein